MKYLSIFSLVLIAACGHKEPAADETDSSTNEVQTPVTVTSIEKTDLEEYKELNATSTYLQSNIIKASANGYITEVNIKPGQFVKAGQPAFTIKTKEARALGNTVSKLDTSFHFTGLINIRATASGFVQQMDHQAGDYVQDGEQLAVLADANSFGFVLNLPYELRKYAALNKTMDIELPDGTHLTGRINRFLPSVDSASQTQGILLSVDPAIAVPQNLVVKVKILQSKKANALSLPKQALLTNEAQTSFWVMKLLDSVTAVRVPVIKGMETGERVEILRPIFNNEDKILLTGNYGLGDTAHVRVVREKE